MIMKNEFICNDVLVVHLTVSQIKAIIESALKEATLSKNVQTEMLTIQEVSELTGYKRATIYKLTCERKIPFHKPAHGGRRIFFKREKMINMKTIISKENMERETFVFYRSYFDAIELLSKKNRLLAYEAIAKYALTQEEIQDLPPQVAIILKMAKPNIDATIRNYNRRVKSKRQKKISDFEDKLNEEVQLPRKKSSSIIDDSFEDNDENTLYLE